MKEKYFTISLLVAIPEEDLPESGDTEDGMAAMVAYDMKRHAWRIVNEVNIQAM